MAQLDTFGLPDFSMANMTAAINALPHKPKLLGQLNLFTPVPVNTGVVKVEKKEGKLALLVTAARGTIGNVRVQPQRIVRTFNLPHVPQYQTIMADDIHGIRAFGSETELQAVQNVVNDNLQGCRDNHEATHEYHRIGAIKGTILDGDMSTTIYNLYTEFGESQTTVTFTDATTEPKAFADTIVRNTANALGNDGFTEIVALCSDDFFSNFTSDTGIRDTYLNSLSNMVLRQSQLGPEYGPYANGFEWGGILWLNYRGTIGGTPYIASNEAYTFPRGVPGMFQEICGPGDSMQAVGTRGQLMYASQHILPHDAGVELKTTSDCLMLNNRPLACQKLVWTT